MRLIEFRVRMFRNVIDSGPIRVDDSTCLVGKNEAGKSAILEALHRLRPANPTRGTLLEEYPRWRLKDDQDAGADLGTVFPIEGVFELDSDDQAAIAGLYHAGANLPTRWLVKANYDEKLYFDIYSDETTFVSQLAGRIREAGGTLEIPGTVKELRKAIEAIRERVTAAEGDSPEPSDALAASLDVLDERLGDSATVRAAIWKILWPRVPQTFYFSSYSELKGRYDFDQVVKGLSGQLSGEALAEVVPAVEFLKLARTSPATMADWNYETSKAELEAVSSQLSSRVKKNWKQNEHLKLDVTIETERLDNGTVRRWLQFRVTDNRHDFTSRLDRRSTGFRWFVSFIACFFEFEKDKNITLLLDEPGLSLHARAQADLLDAIDRHLTVGRQVLYSTHSPFMVRTDQLHRVRVVEDQGPEHGTVVMNEAGRVTDPDTLFPLQAALGYDIAQSLFIGAKNVLVEGVSDVIYLEVLSTHLRAAGRVGLDEDARLLPVRGVTNVGTFIALMGGKLPFVVLLDGASERARIDNAIQDGTIRSEQIVAIDKFSTVKGADIEDVFTPAEYLKLYNATFNAKLNLARLKGTDRIVKRIEREVGAKFDHGRVAGYFLANQTKIVPALSEGTLDRFESLIRTINGALPKAVSAF